MLSDESSESPIGAMEAIRLFFGADGKPVTREELEALGFQGIKELGAKCAEALGRRYLEHS